MMITVGMVSDRMNNDVVFRDMVQRLVQASKPPLSVLALATVLMEFDGIRGEQVKELEKLRVEYLMRATLPSLPFPCPPLKSDPLGCHGGQDGDCVWTECPQLKDGEPQATGRHCPLDVADGDR
jgi:hypothetical protein